MYPSFLTPAAPYPPAEIDEGHGIPYGYKTWTLFLISNPTWLLEQKRDALQRLHSNFSTFGEAIGRKNVAIWFTTSSDDSKSLKIRTDVQRCTDYVELYGLKPSHGPHILITATEPTLDRKVNEYYVLELNGLSSERINDLFAELADLIVAAEVRWRDFASIAQRNAWNRAVNSLTKPLLELWKHITLKVNLGNQSVEIRGS